MTAAKATRRLGARAYARWRKERGLPGATHQAVQKAIESGRIAESVRFTPKGWPKIDPEAADQEWAANTAQEQSRERHRGSDGGAAQGDLFGGPAESSLEQAEEEAEVKGKGASYTRYRAEREQWLSRLARLDYLARDGSLCDVASARVEQGRLWTMVRDAVLNVPERVSGPLEGASAAEIRQRLARELREVFEGLLETAERALSGGEEGDAG